MRADMTIPHYFEFFFQMNHLEDETDYFQYGQQSEVDFYNLVHTAAIKSSNTDWPAEDDPESKYKFYGVDFYLSQDLNVVDRQTYNVLEWIGDIGGLLDGLKLLGQFLVGPASAFAIKAKLLTSFFSYVPLYKAEATNLDQSLNT